MCALTCVCVRGSGFAPGDHCCSRTGLVGDMKPVGHSELNVSLFVRVVVFVVVVVVVDATPNSDIIFNMMKEFILQKEILF